MGRKQKDVISEVEGGHPGYRIYAFTAAPDTLKSIAANVEILSRAPAGARYQFKVWERGRPGARVSLAFTVCTPEQFDGLKRFSRARWRTWLEGRIALVALIGLVLVGLYTVLVFLGQHLLAFLASVA